MQKQYIINKRIQVEAPTLEEAIQKHDKGQTLSLTAEEMRQAQPNPARPNVSSKPSIRNPVRTA